MSQYKDSEITFEGLVKSYKRLKIQYHSLKRKYRDNEKTLDKRTRECEQLRHQLKGHQSTIELLRSAEKTQHTPRTPPRVSHK